MKNIEHYIQKRDETLARIEEIDRKLALCKKKVAVRWRCSPERLQEERYALSQDLKGYNVIIASQESGIRMSRYHNYRQAFDILNREYKEARRKAKNDICKT